MEFFCFKTFLEAATESPKVIYWPERIRISRQDPYSKRKPGAISAEFAVYVEGKIFFRIIQKRMSNFILSHKYMCDSKIWRHLRSCT